MSAVSRPRHPTDPATTHLPLGGPHPMFVQPSDVSCTACPLACSRKHIVNGVGPFKPDVMIVGEAPGREEDLGGTPFVGQSGQLLRATLSELGIDASTCWISNAVKCRPPDNRTPTAQELSTCRQWLDEEIRAIQPRSILTLGRTAQAQVAALALPIPAFHAFHPAYILRSRARTEEWKDQLRGAFGLPLQGPGATMVAPAYILGDPWLDKPYLAVDTETDPSDPDDGGTSRGQTMVCFQVSDGRFANLYEPDDSMLGILRGRHIYVQGAKFDLPLLGVDHHDLDKWDDTQLMSYVLRDDQIGLKPQVYQQHGYVIPQIQTIIGAGKKRIPFSQALASNPGPTRDYAIRDAFGTSLLAESLSARLRDDPPLWEYYTEIEKPTLPLLIDMEARGIQVNLEALSELDRVLTGEIAESERQVTDALGVFNLASGAQLADALTDAGITLTTRTQKTDKLATDEQALLKAVGVSSRDDLVPDLKPSHALIEAILDVRGKKKLKTTYVKGLTDARDASGRVHARFNQTRTNTNRLSSSDPNLQNIPIRNKALGKAMRRIFESRPGYVLVKGDFSQAEVRVYADYTHEPVLMAAYPKTGPGQDVHQGVADALGIPRYRAKNVVFASLYGAAAPKLAQTAGVPASETIAFLARMRREMPSLLTWQTTCSGQLAQHGYIETAMGWRGYFPGYWSPIPSERKAAVRQAANFPIQGTVAGLVKLLMILADEGVVEHHDADLLLQVHDEVVYEVPRSEARVFAHKLQELGAIVGEIAFGMTVPLVLDVAIGANWGDVVPWQEWRP